MQPLTMSSRMFVPPHWIAPLWLPFEPMNFRIWVGSVVFAATLRLPRVPTPTQKFVVAP